MNPISDGYQKLLGAYEELEQVNSQMVEFTKNEFPEDSTLIAWGAVTYGSYIPGRSDFEFLIVLKEPLTLEQIQGKLRIECFKYTNLSAEDLDIVVVDLDALKRGDFRGINADGIHELTEVEIYIISHFGKILFGEEEVKNIFPRKQIQDFYPKVLERFRKEIQKKLINKYQDGEDQGNFVEANILHLILLYRVLFTHLNGEIWGKIESIDWVINRLEGENVGALKELGKIVKQKYLQNVDDEVKDGELKKLVNKAIWEFLDLTKKKKAK